MSTRPLVRDDALNTIARYAAPHIQQVKQDQNILNFARNRFFIPETNDTIRLMHHQAAILDYVFDPDEPFQYGGTFIYSTIKKCLAIDTPIPTPTGWKDLEDIVPGDWVFDMDGIPTMVMAISDTFTDRECYRVRFSDGESLVADAGHNWRVQSLLEHYDTIIISTVDMISTLRRADGACNYRVPMTGPLRLPAAALPIDPYVLGAWLGDGTSANGNITCIEPEILCRIASTEVVKETKHTNRAATYTIGWVGAGGNDEKRSRSLSWRLRELDLLDNKHIPKVYLRASFEQRVALLQGLMDTDGYISKPRGRSGCECEISTKFPSLYITITELLTSLGLKSTSTVDHARLYGKDCGARYRIKFHAPSEMPVFYLERKASRQRSATDAQMSTRRSTNRHIVEIEEVGTVPVKCITVAAKSHTFLAGRGMIPTCNSGKTSIASLVGRWIAEEWGNANEIFTLANDEEQSRGRIYDKILKSIELDPTYIKKASNNGWKIIERQATYEPNGSIVKALSSDYRGEAGSNPTATLWSEIWGFSQEAARRLWDELTTVPTRVKSIRMVESYAGFEDSSELLLELYKLGLAGRRLTHDDIDWPFDDQPPIWVNENAKLFMYWDSGVQARRMPWQTEDYYRTQAATLRPQAFERLHLNLWTSSVDSFIPVEWWENCRRPLPVVPSNWPVVIGADAGISSDCTALVAVCRNPENKKQPMILDYVVYEPPQGGTLDLQIVDNKIRELCKRYNVVQIAFDAYQLHKMMTDLRRDYVAWCRPFSQQQAREIADKQLYDLIRDRMILHNTGGEFSEHVKNAAAKSTGDIEKLRIVKKSKDKKVDLLVATSMACSEVLRLNLD